MKNKQDLKCLIPSLMRPSAEMLQQVQLTVATNCLLEQRRIHLGAWRLSSAVSPSLCSSP